MKRSVRSGIAIAGMAGGFWLLGQAVANAEEAPPPTTAAATGTQTSDATGGSGGGGGDADSSNKQSVDASNNVSNNAETGDIKATGGTSTVGVVAGNGNTLAAGSGGGDVTAEQNVTTVVWISSEATGATVSNSGNAAAGNNADHSATATGTQNSEATGGSGRGGGDADSSNKQSVDASNNVSNNAETGDITARGGRSSVGVVAGNENLLVAGSGHHRGHHDGDVDATQNINTSVTVHSSATGATVTNSGNASAGNNASYSATATGTQNSEATGGDGPSGRHDWDHHGKDGRGGHHHHHNGGDADSSNHQHVDSSNNVDNNATTGEINAGGGTSAVGVVAGNGNTLYCTSKSGNVTCSQNITTIINIISQAGGATVSCSGNASAGSTGSAVCPVSHHHHNHDATHKPAAQAAPAAHKAAAPAAHRAPVNTKAQPAGQLAFTGAETSAPLTLGLLALGAGGALTLAGRRRTATAAV